MKSIFISMMLAGSVSFADGLYTKHDANLLQLQGKITAAEKEIMTLIEEKNKATDPAKTHEIAAEIKKQLKDRKENIAKYNKELHHVEFEHPGGMDIPVPGKKPEEKKEEKKGEHAEGDKKKVRYKRYDEKSIKEFEDEVNKLLSNVYDNVKKKYNQ